MHGVKTTPGVPGIPQTPDQVVPNHIFVVKPPIGPAYQLIVQQVIFKNENTVAVCLVQRNDAPGINQILKLSFYPDERAKIEIDLCQKVFDEWNKTQTPYIAKFYGFLNIQEIKEKHIRGIHMKYYPGQTLFQGLYEKSRLCQLPEATLKPIFKSVLVGLDFLHRRVKMAHRDIKLENIFLQTEPNGSYAVLADFGASSDKARMNTVIRGRGFTFTAPEAREGGDFDLRCDIWSAGVLFYVMLFGVDPTGKFTIKKDMYGTTANVNWSSTFQGVADFGRLAGSPFLLPDNAQISQPLRDLLTRMTQFEPQNRPQIAQILQYPYFANDASLHWIQPV